MKILRWIAVLPVATVCGYLAYFVGGFINNLTTSWYLGVPLEGWPKIATDFMAHAYFCAAFTYSAVRIAPAASRYVALAALLLLLVFSGFSLWSYFAIGKFNNLPGIIGILFGGTCVLFSTFAGEIVPYDANRVA